MKCPHCNFERELPFKFCPMWGVKAVDNVADDENLAENQPNTEETAVQPEVTTFVRRIPHGFTEKTYNERKGIKKLSRLSDCAFLSISLISGVIAYIVLFGLMFFGYSLDGALEFLEDPFFSQFFQISI